MQHDSPAQAADTDQKIAALAEQMRLQKAAEMQTAILNSLPAHIALLDTEGVIVAVNEAWRSFASANVLQSSDFFVGQNYLGVCESAHGDCAEEARSVANGIRQVLKGEIKEFVLEYPCHSPTEERWFRLMVTPLSEHQMTGAVVIHVNVTERKQTEKTLRENQQRLEVEARRLNESQMVAGIGSWECDLSTLDAIWTEQTHRIFETSPEHFIPNHQRFLERVHPDDRAAVDTTFVQSIGQSGQFAIEHRLLMPDGRIKFVEERWRIFRDAADRPVRALGTCQDITERRRAAESLAESQALLRIAGQAARLGGWSLEVTSYQLKWSDETCMIHDLPPASTPTLEEALHFYAPEYRDEIGRHAKLCAEEGTPFDVELEILTAKQRRIWVRALGEAVRDEKGQIRRIQGAFQDISQQKAAEEAARSAGARLLDTVESITDGFYTLDREWCFTYINAESERLLNCHRSTLLGRSIWEAYQPVLGTVIEHEYRRAVAENRTVTFEEYYPPLDMWVEVKAYPSAEGLAVYFRDVSERHRTLAALRASESKFRQLADSNVLGIITWDAGGNISEANDAFLQMTGYTREELQTGQIQWRQITPPEHLAADELALEEVATTGRCTPFEKEYLHKDGHRVAVMVGAASLDGAKDRGICYVVDISQQKQAEAKVRASEASLLHAQQIARIGNWDWNIVTNEVYWSAQVYELYGIVPDEFGCKYETFLQVVHPEDRERVNQAVQDAVAGTAPYNIDHRVLWPDGTVRVMHEQGEVTRDAEGRALKMTGTVQDITERRRAEEALRTSEERFRLMIEGSEQVLFYTHDREHRFEYLSPSTLAVLGYEPAELVGQPCDVLVIQDDPENDNIHELTDKAMQDGRPCEPYLAVVRHKDGRRIVLEILESPILNEGRIVGIQGFARDITERETARSAVAASEREFRSLAEAMPQIVWITRPDGWNTYCNQHWVDYTGLSQEESVGHGWNKPFHPEDQQRAWDAWQKATTNLSIYELECRLRRVDGAYRWWLVRGEPQRDAAGRVIKWFGTCTDIHDLKVAEMEITRTNRALKLLSGCNAALIHAEDEAALLRDVCQLAVDIGGYRMAWVGYAQDDEAHSIQPMSHAGAEDGYLTEINLTWDAQNPTGKGPAGQTIRGGQAVVCADMQTDPLFQWLEAAQQRGYRAVICLPLRDKKRTFGLLGLYSAEVNVTNAEELRLLQDMADDLAFGILTLRLRLEQRQADARLREQATLLDKAQDAILVRDLDHQILYWNRSAEQLYGWTADEAVGSNARQLLHTEAGPLDVAVQKLLKEGEWVGELQQITKDDRLLTIEAHWSLVRDELGRPKSILSINTDVTERKKIEAQYLRAQRMESIGTLAGGIAHDLNNVLTPIMMSIELLKMQEKDARRLNILTTIEGSAKRGADMVRQVLSFARGVEGQQLEVQVGHLVKEIEKIVQDTFLKNIEVRSNIPADLWLVQGDPTQLHQVLLNLCVNARDAMPNGGTLSLAASNLMLDEQYSGMNIEAKPGPHVRILVEDSGTGMPPEVVERIFEPFFTTKELGKGTGLGLSTTLAIIKSHGGFVRVYSEVGMGTRFHIYLPAQAETGAVEADAASVELPRGNDELVLVIDDEAAVRQITRQTLEAFGYRVLLASDGVEATSVYATRNQEIDLVLTDMMMPLMDGPTTIQVLLRLNPQALIIAASGLNANGMVAKAANAGVKHFIPKPYTAETLLKTLREVLESRKMTSRRVG